MGRVPQQKSGKQAAPANGLRAQKVSKQRNKHHKVVLEDVGQQSRSVLSFRTDPPAGYTFIPAGNPELTAALKEFAKKGNHQIYAVSATPHASRHELSREVHRIGFHFPTEVVASVCSFYGIRLTSGGKLVEEKDDDKLFMRLKQRGLMLDDNEPLSEDKKRDQVTINTEAKQIIKDLFPHIPDNDLFQIIKTAFQLGDGKVGTADEIPLVRRAQLSVVAHIRHTYTSYDKLLRQVAYSEARHRVENETLKKLIEWRGDEDDKQAVEDTLREVVVISDEEDSDDEVEDGQILDHTDVRVQLIDNAGRQDPTASHRQRSPIQINSDDEAPKGYRYVPQVVRRVPVQGQLPTTAAKQESRYAIWDRYRQEYRAAMVPQQPVRIVERILIEDPTRLHTEPSYTSRDSYYRAAPQRTMEPPVRALPQPQPSTPTFVRAADGRLYERIVLQADSGNASIPSRRNYTPPTGSAQYYRSAPGSPRVYQQTLHQRTSSIDDNDGSVIPSIEGPTDTYASPLPRRNAPGEPTDISQKRHSGTLQYFRPPLVEMSDASEQSLKRRRMDATPPASYGHHSESGTRQMVTQRIDDYSPSRVTGYAGGHPEASPYATRQQVYYEPLAVSETARADPPTTFVHRETQVFQSPRVLNHGDQIRRAYVEDHHTQHPYDPMTTDDRRRTNYVSREHPRPIDDPNRRHQQEYHGRLEQNIPVRYIYADDSNTRDSHSQRGQQIISNGAHFRDSRPVQTLGSAHDAYHHHNNAQPPPTTFPTQGYR